MPPIKHSNRLVNRKVSVTSDQLDTVKKQTRILSYEKDIVGFALTQIDDAQTTGHIGERAHTQLLTKYSNKLTQLEQQLSNNQNFVRLDELTTTKNSLTYLFTEKMGHISSEITEIQSLLITAPLESQRQVIRDQEPEISPRTRQWGSMKNVFVFFAVIMLLISSSSYAFGFLFNQQYFTQDFVDPQESAQSISDQRITSSTGITASVNLGVYFDNATTREVSSIDWGIVYPDDQIQYIIYLRNSGNVNCQLLLNTTDWTPPEAQDLIIFTWDYNEAPIEPGTIIQVTVSLRTSAQLAGFEQFGFNIIITSISLE
jgi:hypothetical protein